MDENKITTGDGDQPPPPNRDRAVQPSDPPRRAYDDEPLPRVFSRVYQQDKTYMTLLVVFHYVLAGMAFLFGLCPLMYVGMGIFMVSGAMPTPPPPPGGGPAAQPPPFEMMGWMFIAEFGFFFVMLYAAGILACLVGINLQRRKRWTFCIVCSGIQCMFMPFGTVLGIFTIVVLVRESVKDVFKYGEPRISDEDFA